MKFVQNSIAQTRTNQSSCAKKYIYHCQFCCALKSSALCITLDVETATSCSTIILQTRLLALTETDVGGGCLLCLLSESRLRSEINIGNVLFFNSQKCSQQHLKINRNTVDTVYRYTNNHGVNHTPNQATIIMQMQNESFY